MRWLDSILVIVRNGTMIQSWEKDISVIGTNLQRTILFKKMNDLVYDYKMELE